MSQSVITWVDARIAEVLRAPRMWGATAESVELQGEFGAAYVKAVAHAAGYFVEPAGRWADEAGIDLTILSLTESGLRKSPRLDVQVKTTIDPLEGDPFPYDLAANNYNQLCDTSPHNLPSILVRCARS